MSSHCRTNISFGWGNQAGLVTCLEIVKISSQTSIYFHLQSLKEIVTKVMVQGLLSKEMDVMETKKIYYLSGHVFIHHLPKNFPL